MKKLVTKEKIVSNMTKRLQKKATTEQINNIIAIFIEEFNQELEIKKSLTLGNFCSFKLGRYLPRKYHNVRENKIFISKGRKYLKIVINSKLRKLIVKHLDILKTFAEEIL